MKTLLLTSSGSFITTNNIDEYLPKKITECKIAYIITASKKVFDTGYITKHKANMDKLGFNYDEIDIAGKTEYELEKILNPYDIVLVEGGNTYYLLKTVRESGFENIVRKLLEKGIIYIGSSAGSYIATPSIIPADWSDRGFDKCSITDYTGMNLTPFIIKAHYTVDQLEYLKEKSEKLDFPLTVLNDNQAILLRNSKTQLLGGGDEIVL